MEPITPPKSIPLPFFYLLFLSSISPSLSLLSAAPKISPRPQPSTSPSPSPSISISISISNDSPQDNEFLEKICKSTDYPILCVNTIHPLLKGKTDVITILDAAMKAGLDATKVGIILAKNMSTKPGTSPDIASLLNGCKNSYEDALENFQKAMIALPIRDIGLLNSMLSAVITDVMDCEDDFSGNVSPLAPYASKIVNMTSNCLAIVSLIPDHMKYASLG